MKVIDLIIRNSK